MPKRKKEITGIIERSGLPAGYAQVLKDLKIRVHQSQVKAALTVNRNLIALYWHIGKVIVERQQAEGWGKSVVERLAHDLQREFFARRIIAELGKAEKFVRSPNIYENVTFPRMDFETLCLGPDAYRYCGFLF